MNIGVFKTINDNNKYTKQISLKQSFNLTIHGGIIASCYLKLNV